MNIVNEPDHLAGDNVMHSTSFVYDFLSSMLGRRRPAGNNLAAKIPTFQPEENPVSTFSSELASSSLDQHSATDRLLNTVELVEAILLEIPILDVVRAQRVCRHFKDIIEASPRLQQHLFLKPSSRTAQPGGAPEFYVLNPIFDPGNENFCANRLTVAGWKFDLAMARRPAIVENISSSSRRTRDIVRGFRCAIDVDNVAELAHRTTHPLYSQERSAKEASRMVNLTGPWPGQLAVGDQSYPHAIRISLECLDHNLSDSIYHNGSWRKMSITQPPLPIICNEFDMISRPPVLGLVEEWYSIAELCADDSDVP